jgi:hypothetical protein
MNTISKTPNQEKIPEIGKLYRHYKSTGGNDHVYKIIGLAKHSETEDLLVIYEPIIRSGWMQNTEANFAARPQDMFMETVELDGQTVPRFQKIID